MLRGFRASQHHLRGVIRANMAAPRAMTGNAASGGALFRVERAMDGVGELVGREGLGQQLDIAEQVIAAKPFAAGAKFGIADVFALRMETIGAIANMVVEQQTFRLPDGYWDTYRTSLREVGAETASSIARRLFSSAHQSSSQRLAFNSCPPFFVV